MTELDENKSEYAEAIWKLLSPYIASEDLPDSHDAAHYLMESVLPNVWDHVLALEKRLSLLSNFDNQPTKHVLRLIAKDMQGDGTRLNVMRSRGNWLMRLVKALEANG